MSGDPVDQTCGIQQRGCLIEELLDDAKREKRRLAQREYRRRFDAGKFTVAVEIDGAVVEMLVATGWLVDGECDRKKIAKALSAMVAEAAKR